MPKTSEAQKRATAKYRQEHQLLISYRYPKELVEAFRETAKARGDSQGAVIRAAVENYIASKSLSEAAGEPLTQGIQLPIPEVKSSLRLTEATTEALQEKAEALHLTTDQLGEAIISDWLAEHP